MHQSGNTTSTCLHEMCINNSYRRIIIVLRVHSDISAAKMHSWCIWYLGFCAFQLKEKLFRCVKASIKECLQCNGRLEICVCV